MKTENIKTNQKAKNNQDSAAMRIDVEIKNSLEKEVEKLRRLKKGSGKIKVCHILSRVLPLLNDQHREEILALTVTGEDRQKVAYSAYKKKHKKISRCDFLDLIQYGEININDYLPMGMRRTKKTSKSNRLEIA